MTIAVCFHCGEFKFGAWTQCPKCRALPRTEDDYVVSMALTDHYFDRSTLEQMGQSVKQGQRPNLDAQSREKLIQELRKTGWIEKLSRMQSSSSSPPPRKYHYTFAYEILPVLAITDPRISTGLAIKTPELDMLGDLWGDIQKEHDVTDPAIPTGQMITLPNHGLVLVTMPRPLEVTEAYYVGIVYPRAWLEDQRAFNSTRPKTRIFVLAMDAATEVEDRATLREIKGLEHSPVAFGIAATPQNFTTAVLAILDPKVPPEPAS